RQELLSAHHAFETMEYTEDRERIAEWAPLLIPGRDASERIAATRVERGTDVNFGALTQALLQHLQGLDGAHVGYNQKVKSIKRDGAGWSVAVKNTQDGGQRTLKARFVFLGAGGGALPLL